MMKFPLFFLLIIILFTYSCKETSEEQTPEATINEQDRPTIKDSDAAAIEKSTTEPESALESNSISETEIKSTQEKTNTNRNNHSASKGDSTSSQRLENSEDAEGLKKMAMNYADAWSSQNSAKVASFFAPNGTLILNGKEPAKGNEEISKVVNGFMTTFPDLKVTLNKIDEYKGRVKVLWTFTGTNAGKQGNGNKVNINVFESWDLNREGQIVGSKGRFDTKEYQRQLLGK